MRAAIILAAGASHRFGRRDKLQAKLGVHTLLEHVVGNARASGAQRILLVTVRPTRVAGVTNVRNRAAWHGLSSSLAVGLRALRPLEREALIFLADMPFARAPRMKLRPGLGAVRPGLLGRPGHPVLIRVGAAKAALECGDAGRAGRLPPALVRGTPAHMLDIDTPRALQRARRHGSRAFRPRSVKG